MEVSSVELLHGGNERTNEYIQAERMAVLKSYCRNNGTRYTEFPTRRRFVVSEKYKVLYCQVFKTGSTTTLTILHNLEHDERRNTHDMRVMLDDLPFKRLNTYSDEQVRLRLKTYTKLIIVRNPLERLASAWEDKFYYAPSRFGYRKQYHSMLETLSSNTSKTQAKSSKRRGCTSDLHGGAPQSSSMEVARADL
uniref:Carbohydrate sulfotransferase n=1 Tax=Branchiostoma floridae TaxID=7739 RepID=C3ZQK9_BRAFL|eukprot:XP_002589254.1 hypothetical protein BRAFLDRAFT_74589 [Branchiostoma floridae]